jgi:hypothetical protein
LQGVEKKTLARTLTSPPVVVPKGELIFANLDEIELARQLTLWEYEAYCVIKPRECLNQGWNKLTKQEDSPNIVNMIRRSNSVTLWVATEIIKEEKLQKRAMILKKFIKIAEVYNLHSISTYQLLTIIRSIAEHSITLRELWKFFPV